MGAEAAQQALHAAGLSAREVDCIIFATLSPDVDMPASACLLQHRLGIGGMPAFDVRNQCSGFIYSLRSRTSSSRPAPTITSSWSVRRSTPLVST